MVKPERKKRQQSAETFEALEAYLLKLSDYATAPKTFRMPEPVIFRLERLARELDTSSGKLITDLLEELLPAFEQGRSSTVKFRTIKKYLGRKESNRLQPVDLEKLFLEVEAASTPRKRSGETPSS